MNAPSTTGLFCPVAMCDRNPAINPKARPFDNSGALGLHKRRRHGIMSVALALKRPPGGTITCPHGCSGEPYVTLGGLGAHMRSAHGWRSQNPESIARRCRRLEERVRRDGITLPQDPPPRSDAIATYAPEHARDKLTTTQRAWLRRRLLFVVNGMWARELDMPPAALRDEIFALCLTNFAEIRSERSPETPGVQ